MSARRPPSNLRLALLALALTAGCATAPPPREPVAPDAQRALALLIEGWHAFSDLRTLADIVVERGGERQRLTGILLAKAPGSLRFEALSPFGQPYLLVTIHDGQLTAYDATTNEAFVGPANAETTARVLSLPFDPDDLVGVLAGRVAPPKDLRVARLVAADGQGPALDLAGGVQRKRVWMDLDTGLVRQIEISGGWITARISYHRDIEGAVTGFELSAAHSLLTGSVRYRNTVTGGGIDAERFTLTIPKGAKIQTIR